MARFYEAPAPISLNLLRQNQEEGGIVSLPKIAFGDAVDNRDIALKLATNASNEEAENKAIVYALIAIMYAILHLSAAVYRISGKYEGN